MSKTVSSQKMKADEPPGIRNGIADLPNHLNAKTIGAGLIATVFGCTGPPLIIMSSAMNAGYTTTQTISWLASVCFFGGLISVIMALRYKQPIVGAWSIPVAVMLGNTLAFFSIEQAVGAYLMGGLLVLILGASGLVGKIMRLLPMPIVMGMIAGAMIKFGTDMISSIEALPVICGAALAAYFLAARFFRLFPPALGALVVGIVVAVFYGGMNFSGGNYSLVLPTVFVPSFSFDAFLSISLPLALLVIGAENAQATGVLLTEGYKPPVNAMTVASGIGGIVSSFFGGHNANVAGPMTAICASGEAGQDKEGRYAAAVVNGILFAGFGVFASVAVALIQTVPSPLVSVVAGLAMIGVLIQSFEQAFVTGRFRVGAFFALVIAMSGITLFQISAPFWALIGGVLVSLIIEPKDFVVPGSAGQNPLAEDLV